MYGENRTEMTPEEFVASIEGMGGVVARTMEGLVGFIGQNVVGEWAAADGCGWVSDKA